MANRDYFQKQLAALVADAQANNLHFGDILPDSLKEHIHGRAREYIKELEAREKVLQADKDAMTKELYKKQVEIDNLPAEHEARKVDLQQAERQIALHKEMSVNLTQRLDRYRRQLNDIVDQKQADVANAEKIEFLETQTKDQQAIIHKLMEDNCKSEAMFEKLREADAKALERKDEQLANKNIELREKNVLLAELRQIAYDAETHVDSSPDDSCELLEENIVLMSQNVSLSDDNEAWKEQYSIVKVQLIELTELYERAEVHQRNRAKLFAAAVSEIKTLSRFYKAAFSVLSDFANDFNAAKASVPSPIDIESRLHTAHDALAGYASIRKVVRADTDRPSNDEEEVTLCKELDSLGTSAADSMISIEVLSTGLWRFLAHLSDDPKLLSQLNSVLYVNSARGDCASN